MVATADIDKAMSQISDIELALERMHKALDEINMLACYASEENTDAREAVLLKIGEVARWGIANAEGK